MKLVHTLIKDPYSLTLKDFYKIDIDQWNNLLLNREDEFWLKRGEQMAINLFKMAATRVPAYKDFLKKNKINADKINAISDFNQVPIINKKNYLTQYPLESLCLDSKLHKSNTISVSSGSTGLPFFWPRGPLQEFDTALHHEVFLKNIFEIDKKKTLLIVAYSMGMYVAGPFTFSSSQRVSIKGYPITVVTPGINKIDVVRVIKHLSSEFQQTILAGYPPFVKDILMACVEEGIEITKLNLKFIFGAESFSEEWRAHIYSLINAKNYYKSSMNTYGSADAAILGHESPISILLREIVTKNPQQKSPFIDNERLPSLHQYNPILRFFECEDTKLLFTAPAGIPLVRYDIGDNGGLLTYNEVINWLKQQGVDIKKVIKKNNLDSSDWKLPFVYLYGRRDFTVTLYGLNIYPENIKDALLLKEISQFITGKFVMSQEYDKDHNQFLQIRIELQPCIQHTSELISVIQTVIIKKLKEVNREYNRLFEAIGDKAKPRIILETYGNRELFSEGVKQKWVKK